ncbi:unnamed protein product [Rotaria sordida]|uniref:Uncharacterized protein n=1 Tax=Rotaria sordida TaxID=392033 RepID=A0A815KW70_9BILA|nr:unnamed protein product [Rotaria sordida]CAF1401845.1 unnamed protein product [Rotaria sordida]
MISPERAHLIAYSVTKSSCLSLPEKKRQRSNSCKHAQLMDKRLKSSSSHEDIEITIPNAATRTTSFNNLNSHKNDCSSFINAN